MTPTWNRQTRRNRHRRTGGAMARSALRPPCLPAQEHRRLQKKEPALGRLPVPVGSLGSRQDEASMDPAAKVSSGKEDVGAGEGRGHRGRAFRATALLAVLMAGGCQRTRPAVEVRTLHDGWTLVGVDTFTTPIPATVPGTVQTDLMAARLVADPYWRGQADSLEWIAERDWIYRTAFTTDSAFLAHERIELLFKGLDTFAQVFLNGREVLRSDNMFREWKVDVAHLLRVGTNELEVRFSSPLRVGRALRSAHPYSIPMDHDAGDPPTRAFVRKAAYHYGWDWGPRLVTSGIWREVELVAWNGPRLRDFYTATASLGPDQARLAAFVEVEVSPEAVAKFGVRGSLPITVEVSSPHKAFPRASRKAQVEAGVHSFILPVEVRRPRLWWPNGLGEPHLYTIQAEVRGVGTFDRRTIKAGIRTLELVLDPDSVGESFYFRVNGVPVFAKGANVVPLDHFAPRVKDDDYRRLFRDVVAAHMNMLRVWGGGIYPPDLFYDLADEYGILVWQDFMFANAMVPGDSAFVANVRAEAVDQIRRLRGHPSLALWCGNNEIEEGWRRWGWARGYASHADSAAVERAYAAVFYGALPDAVSRHDPSRAYWPSSPMLGWGEPESLRRGDSHYWGVWHGGEPFEVYLEKLPRFASEYGFQGFPPMETLQAFTQAEDRSLDHSVLRAHQRHPRGFDIIREYMVRDYPVPADLEDFAYLSQLLQARGVRMAFEAHRRARPRTMGTLYWQLNDTWPAISWSSRDWFGRWKALHYAAKKAFAPLLVSLVEHGERVEAWGVWDGREPWTGELFLELLDFAGTSLWEAALPVTLPPHGSIALWQAVTEEVLRGHERSRVVLRAELRASASTRRQTSSHGEEAVSASSENLLYFERPKHLSLEAPRVQIRTEGGPKSGTVRVILRSEVVAKDVALSLEGDPDARFEENFLDLLPGRPKELLVETRIPPEEARGRLRLRTLAEVPREGVPPTHPRR